MGSQENDLSCASELSRWKGLEETVAASEGACGSLLCVDCIYKYGRLRDRLRDMSIVTTVTRWARDEKNALGCYVLCCVSDQPGKLCQNVHVMKMQDEKCLEKYPRSKKQRPHRNDQQHHRKPLDTRESGRDRCTAV